MIQLTAYGERVVDRLSMMGMWLAVIVSIRNFTVCLAQYKRTRGRIHIVNMAQVVVLMLHRFLYGIIPLFEISTCAYFPLLVSLWHITYILFYTVMFMRLIILESDRHSLWIKIVGVVLIALRFADWPYELTFHSLQQDIMRQELHLGGTCWAQWGTGVIILNFVGDVLANLFLSGMFVRRLYLHIRMSKSVMTRQNHLIESIARKSLICLILTFVVNLAMNLLKVTNFIGDRSDAFTVYFQLIESTLLVEALRVAETGRYNHSVCENCGMAITLGYSIRDSKEDHGNNNHRGSFLSRITQKSKRSSAASLSMPATAFAQKPQPRSQQPTPDDSILRGISLYDTSSSFQPDSSNNVSNNGYQQPYYEEDEEVAMSATPGPSTMAHVMDEASGASTPLGTVGLHNRTHTSPRPPPPVAVSTSIARNRQQQLAARPPSPPPPSAAPSPRPYSPTTTATTASPAYRPPLSQQHPEWSNNDYRMF